MPYRIYKALTVKTAADGGFEVGRDELDWRAMLHRQMRGRSTRKADHIFMTGGMFRELVLYPVFRDGIDQYAELRGS